jgi:hypothetical protein
MLAGRRLTGATVAVRKNSVRHDGCFVDNSRRIIDIDFATANHSSQDIATDIVAQGLTADCESCLGSYREDILGHCFIYRCWCQQRGVTNLAEKTAQKNMITNGVNVPITGSRNHMKKLRVRLQVR